jgi:tetratricopeptide (TPR) repeat protein
MSYYVHGSSLRYQDYLQGQSFVSDLTGAARDAGHRVSMEVSRQTRKVIASNEALTAQGIQVTEAGFSRLSGNMGRLSEDIGTGFSELQAEMSEGFERVSYDLQGVSGQISELNATFHWGFGQMLAGIGRMSDTLAELVKIAKTPAQTAAYEQYEIARDAFRQGLYIECLESLEKAIGGDQASTGYKLEWRFHQMKGTIYLGFVGADLPLVDLPKAEETFLLAARYAKSDYPDHAGQAFLSAGWAAYCQGKMTEALSHTEQAMAINPKLGEAFFQAAKVRMALGDVDKALPVLAKAIDLDRFYALKAAADGDFRPHDKELRDFLEAIKTEKFRQLESSVRSVLERYEFWLKNDPQTASNPIFQSIEKLLATGSSSTLLDMLAVAQEIDKNLKDLHDQAQRSLIRVVKRTPGSDKPCPEPYEVEEEYESEEVYPTEETYVEEVVIRPAGIFRKAVTEMRKTTRTVMKTRQIAKTRSVIKMRTVMKKNETIRTEFYNGLGEKLTPTELKDMLPEKEWRVRYGRSTQ